ncbi:CDP-diacylglycerol--glycerol-3-phosphate 3-phosphatidyltransferase [Lignipirellula cremea]|uniref:CDP-diacylglycerol--glycerol-3-phosphate 3-phosphatidyltransferase n=1 Tax=Lignipirellula cremea TaxID=2528010 RepID=A0A518E357_9BACT|nr:CDP-diacylglycerol--glycerol-3-phosphate 3-phosphatidyltransferase [Lignipirellula cremea]QDU98483.1 CDP-diacylglycerol--glycerol-3-phosphate 3-phosphatidyltransferase [Lignipirellula cremea]
MHDGCTRRQVRASSQVCGNNRFASNIFSGDSMGTSADQQLLNVPNALTAARFVLALVVFALIPLEQYLAALIIFIIAASTDWVDGWWARKYNQSTKFGRMFDPFVDKIIICGVFVFLAAAPNTGKFAWTPDSGIHAWMAVLVVGREMLVTALRSMIEQEGSDFSAKYAGKLKMVFQCVAVGASLVTLRWFAEQAAPLPLWIAYTLHGSVWLAILSTLYSGGEYILAAAKFFGR